MDDSLIRLLRWKVFVLYLTYMVRIVFLAVLCFCSLVLAQGADYEQDVFLSVRIDPADMFDEWKVRDNLLHALKEGDVAKADAALEFLSQAKVPESVRALHSIGSSSPQAPWDPQTV